MIPESVNYFLTKHPTQTLNFRNKQISYISSGSGDSTVLCLLGAGQTPQSNFGMIEVLGSGYRVICPMIDDFDSVDQFCNATINLLNHEGVDRFNIHGLSVGGLMAQSLILRNPNRIDKVVLNHACTPNSQTFRRNAVLPLLALEKVLPIIPDNLIKFFARNLAGRIQGVHKPSQYRDEWNQDSRNREMNNYFYYEWLDKYLNKRLLQTWCNLDVGFTREKLKVWPGKVSLINTGNDPLVGVDNNLLNLYPNAQRRIFHGTGHMTYFLQFGEVMKSVSDFFDKD